MNFLTDCSVIGNASALGVGYWRFKSSRSDKFLKYLYNNIKVYQARREVNIYIYMIHPTGIV